MTVLLVDDSPTALAFLKASLKKMGHEVVTAQNGNEAWEALQDSDIQLVITDWMMPECDGLELCRRIRESSDGLFRYIIIQTARTESGDLVKAMDAGADDYIPKPISGDELRVRVRAAIRMVELEQNLSERLREVSSANHKMELDLQAAARVQNALLPPPEISIPGVDVSWAYEPCDKVAGDILNIFPLDEEHLGLYVLDVSGHGVPAAMMAVSVSRMLSPLLDSSNLVKQVQSDPPYYRITPPEEVAQILNTRYQLDINTYQYFTILYGVLDLRSGVLRYTQAGHPGPILIPKGEEPKVLGHGEPPIGFFNDTIYTVRSVRLKQGDRLYLYSDGLYEARNAERKEIGIKNLCHRLSEGASGGLKDSVKDAVEEVRQWVAPNTFDDDVTMLALEFNNGAA